MNKIQNIQQSIADTILARPVNFKIGVRHFSLYQQTLGASYIIGKLYDKLDVDSFMLVENPYMEAIRLCDNKKELVSEILAYNSFFSKEDILNTTKVLKRAETFLKLLRVDEMARLFILSFDSGDTNAIIRELGLEAEADKRRRIYNARENRTFATGGKSVYGTLIDQACSRYGWTFDYVVWGITLNNLRLMLADTISEIYATPEELAIVGLYDNVNVVNAGYPKNADLLRSIITE